ncbi:unnamed protein product [Echinostoma caproni]|uniref:Fibronectin type-III domain-containing protein n=1 Tax=Echinostoma caproni TaxID=27848 RepID=A0A183A602_9TREM|nr:unnamed protein product [Echinostoma caproni]
MAKIGEVLKALTQLPTQLRTECSRLSVGFLYYDETGDSPSGWSCLTGCRILDAALKHRSGECPPTGGPAIHRLPSLSGDIVDEGSAASSRSHDSGTGENSPDSRSRPPSSWFSHPSLRSDTSQSGMCTVDAECPKKRDKCCQGQCKAAMFREDMLPPIPTVRILEAKSPPSFLLSWERGLRMLNNLTEPIVYVLQVKTYFGPEFDNRLSSAWKTLVMSTLTGAQLSEPGMGWWYQFQVAAVNRWGSRGFELPTPPVQLTSHKPRPPSAPRDLSDGILTLHANGEIRVEIHWSPPALASIPVTEYRIYWGPDATHSPQEPGFSEKPTQFVQTVPAVLAMSAWGTVQLRSDPSQLFLKTPPVSHLHQPTSSGYPARADPSKWTTSSRPGEPPQTLVGPQSGPYDEAEETAIPDHSMACVCEGTSKSEVLPSVTERESSGGGLKSRLQLHTDPAIYDGSDLRVRLQLSKPISKGDLPAHLNVMSNAELQNLQYIIRWTPQVCIETRANLQAHSTALKSDTDGIGSVSSRRSSTTGGSQFVTLMQMAADEFGTQSGLINLNQVRRGGPNETMVRFGELQLTRLQLNCRYLIQVYNVASTTPLAADSPGGRSQMQLAACLCTPTCTKVSVAPWVPPLSCFAQEKQSLPEPQQLAHRLIQTSPLSYNITWLPGLSGTGEDPSRPRTNRSNQSVTLADPHKRGTEIQTVISGSEPTRDIHYRVVWGPSRDKPIGAALWKTWPGLRPRLDPGLAETKVLRNGETSIVLSSLAPETQYVVKIQAITGTYRQSESDGPIPVDRLTDPGMNRETIRISSSPSELSLLASKEVFLYFKTPRTAQSFEAGGSTHGEDAASYEQLNSRSGAVEWHRGNLVLHSDTDHRDSELSSLESGLPRDFLTTSHATAHATNPPALSPEANNGTGPHARF